MTGRDDNDRSPNAPSPRREGRIDDLCTEFEQAWTSGHEPRIEDYLARVAEDDRPFALTELIALEVDLRRSAGQPTERQEYHQRFPNDPGAVEAAFALLDERGRSNPADMETESRVSRQPSNPGGSSQESADDETHLPERIGRYRIERLLGKGGFGVVYQGYDEGLERPVAVKVPHAKLVARAEDAQAYLREARTVANLDHPNIVPVYDVGSTDEFACYIVSKYIDGTNLADNIKQCRPDCNQATELVATVAEALHYAHKQGLVHRDVKPGNILLDTSGKAFVVDFGLALREQDVGKGPIYAGTPPYMSPEQGRGEGHRVDGRSDIFSLGVVLYEMLVGRKPFKADTTLELLEQIAAYEPRPPRQYDDSIPKELERICLKSLSKRATDRYTTARDLADELEHFLSEIPHGANRSLATSATPEPQPSNDRTAKAETGVPPETPPATPGSDSQPIRIVPKGLRSFDEHDADFFLELLPGPRDRDGLPDSIRFWKSRIEETDSDSTFPVGLIYGPSGCGKSSLVQAGLLPRLSEHVIAVYVQATANDTEVRLLNGLRRRCPALPENPGLKDTLAALRRGQAIPPGKKVLIVLDQFEQWLHTNRDRENTELVQALRQCDGGRVQSIVMVRDDFWLAVSRFLKELEVRLVEGRNSALIDLFDTHHARKILAAFGRAFGRLPENPAETSADQNTFLQRATSDLAEDGKVVCVRLALFAEMMKGKSWTPAALKEVGGTKGAGVTFLEETFSASTAPPEHRYHQKAARAALKALLPDAGTDIKGAMRSHDELLDCCGYAHRRQDFDDLVRILDSETRLITPTEPEGAEVPVAEFARILGGRTEQAEFLQTQLPPEVESGGLRVEPQKDAPPPASSSAPPPVSSSAPPPSALRPPPFYQLTHDYLVPALREWLTRKQKETRRGRAELRLAERATLWNARPERRHLPSVWEWANIRWLTRKKHWTQPQRKMMKKADRYHVLRAMAMAAALTVLGFVLVEGYGRLRSAALVDALASAETADVPNLVRDVASYRRWADPALHRMLKRADADSKQRLHASLALLPVDAAQSDFLFEQLLSASPDEFPILRDALAGQKAAVGDRLWQVVAGWAEDERTPASARSRVSGSGAPQDDQRRFRAACALAVYAPKDPRWQRLAGPVAEHLVSVNTLHIGPWAAALRPVRENLLPPLSDIFTDPGRGEMERSLATTVLEDYAADRPDALADLIAAAEPKQFTALFPALKTHGEKAVEQLRKELDKEATPEWKDATLDAAWAEPDPSLVQKIEAAHGLLGERFAFCQTMPLDEFLAVAEALRASGYRPTRFRPYAAADSVQVAAVWTRDGRDWRIDAGLTFSEILGHDQTMRGEGYVALDLPVDVAGYVQDSEEGPVERYAVLWRERRGEEEDARMLISGGGHEDQNSGCSALHEQGFEHGHALQAFCGVDGQLKRCELLSLQARSPSELWNVPPSEYEGTEHPGKILWDVAVSPAPETLTTEQRYARQLAEAEEKLLASPGNADAFFSRLVAKFYLGKTESALEDLNVFLARPRTEGQRSELGNAYQLRARIHARAGQADAARKDLVKFKELSTSDSGEALVDAVVSAHLGEDDKGIKRLEQAIAAHPTESSFLWAGACAYAGAASVFAEEEPTKSNLYTERAIALLQQATQHGYDDYMHNHPLLDALRGHAKFREIVRQARLDRRYAAVWQASAEFEAKELHGLSPQEHLDRCRQLVTQGYRPVAISVASIADEQPPVTASVWHRPRVGEAAREALAKSQANAAVGLLRMGHPQRVWPLLQHRPDPSLRTWLIHKFPPLGVDAQVIADRLAREQDVSARRALILSLREFDTDRLSHAARQALLPRLLASYRDDLDPGIHGAAEWLLRRWGQEDEIRQIDQRLATGKVEADRRWYVNGQGQTMVLFRGPVEFLMGSPATEPGRAPSEKLHRCRIGRTFAMGTKEVTVEQFRRFDPDFDHNAMHRCPEPDCPILGVIWYEAAAYCNWLSDQEGIPEDQWCYQPNESGEYAEGMTIRADHLKLAGYRLPTEAEWEYACRAAAATSRYYGRTEQLLAEYAWCRDNANERVWPVGGLKPNDFGMFDMYGNVWEWCADWLGSYKDSPVDDEAGPSRGSFRVLRGGSWFGSARLCRSADRSGLSPGHRDYYLGFRVARSLVDASGR